MSAYIKLSTLEYPLHIGDIELDPNGMTDYAHVEWVEPPQIDFKSQRLAQGVPVQVNNSWKTNWVISQIPDSEEAEKVRIERNRLLTESDWTQITDSTADKAVWATYRQALRDVTAQAGFPWNVDWPTKPE